MSAGLAELHHMYRISPAKGSIFSGAWCLVRKGSDAGVECFDMLGDTVVVVTLPASSLGLPTYADPLAGRLQPESIYAL